MTGPDGGSVVGTIDGRQASTADRERARSVREEVELFGGLDLVFGCRHVPVDGAWAGVLVCSPLPYEVGAAHLPDARLARLLARSGVAVQRFHYRGTGHSDGDPAAVTLEAMVDDAREALQRLQDQAGVESVGFVGTAAGATVAALVARDVPGVPVALWRPFEPAAPDHRLTDLLGTGARPLLVASSGLVESAGGLVDDVAFWRSHGFDVVTVPPVDVPGGAGVVEATGEWLVDRLRARGRV
jgi:hypothetical protein